MATSYKKNVKLLAIGCLLQLLFLSPVTLQAQTFNFNTESNTSIVTAAQMKTDGTFPITFYVWNTDWPNSRRDTAKLKSLNDFIQFFVDATVRNPITTSAYVYRLTYTVTGYTNPADTVSTFTTASDTLTIDYNPDSLSAYQDIEAKKYSGFYKMKIVLTGLYDFTNPSSPVSITPSALTNLNFSVEGLINTQHYDLKYYGSSSSLVAWNDTANVGSNYLGVHWNVTSGNTGVVPVQPVNFELEWTYIDNYQRNPSTGTITYTPISSLNYDFRHNSTRVWLDTNYFPIPLVYQHGCVVYRVRMVRPDSVFYKYPVYSAWSVTADSGSVTGAGTGNYYSVWKPYQNDSLNWQYTVSFAEGGKYKHVLSFYDGLLKNRESITRFNSNPNNLIATQNIYDYEGRPAIKILPTPVVSPAFSYQYNVSLNSVTSLPYKAGDFDTVRLQSCPNESLLSPLASTALANIYYSSSNTDITYPFEKFIPNAQGYPMTQTIYNPAFNDRIDKQGGAGLKLQIADSNIITNTYVGADQEVLNRMFGPNIGWSGFYTKTVTQDPNQQLSMDIKDYQGHQIATSMIGKGPNSLTHAIVSLGVPNPTTYTEDLIAGTTQEIVGNTRSLNKDFYMEAAGNDTTQYIYSFAPWLVCSNDYLSVKASYYYKILDQCGNTVYTEDSTLGTTGVVHTSTPLAFAGSRHVSALGQGPATLQKVLTVHYNDVAAAVDSFMNGPNCLITEDSFIRRSVEAKTFPCPSVSSDPCALKREEMIQELWPGTKYGKYTIQMPSRIINGPSPDDTTSIFDKIPYCCKPDSMIYRYQDTCIVSLPPYVVKGLDTFRNLQTMSADSFIYIFNDSIAAALLPLHPEYCALQQCYVDTFEARLEAIPNAQVALGLNLLSLDSIIKQDPLQPILRLKPFLYAHPEDSLATFMGGKIRLDSIELMKDWCGCADSFQFRECVNHIFNKELSSRSILNNSFVENTYFNDIITMYLQNRERFKNAMTTGGEHDSCWHCQNVRMHLIPSPVFQSVFLPGGGLDLSKGSAWYSMDTSSALLAGLTADFDSSSIPADSLVKLGDSASSYVGSADSVLCVGQIDTILNHLSNCIQGSTTIYNGIQNTLDSLCNAHAVQYGTYSPAQIRFAILRNGGTLTDLCNPYLINYDYFGPEMNSGGSCKSPAYYTNIQNFLNQTAALSSFKKAASSSPSPVSAYTLNTGSTFENAIAALTGSTSVNMFATYQSTSNMYTLFIYKTSPTDTVKVYLRGMPGVSNPFNGLTTDSFAVNNVACITSITPPITVGYIGELSFVGNLYHKSGSTITNSSLLGWTDSVEAMDYLQNPLQQCVPCTQIRALYTQFWDSLTVYGVKGADHPFYQTMLGNFMNYFIGQSYTAGQYQDFITSCALADSVLIPDYVGYANFLFSNTTYANSFDSALQAQDPLVFINPYRETFSGFEMVELDLRKLPSWELYKYVNVCNYWKTNHSTLGVLADGVNLPTQALERPSGGRTALGLVYYPTAYTFSPSPSVIFNTSSTNVTFGSPHLIGQWTGGHFVNQEYDTLYAASGTPPYEISKDIYQLRSYAYNNHIPVSFISNYESTVNPDYFKPQKTAYLQYAYKYQQSPPYQVLDSLQALYLQQRVALFGSEFLSYTRPFDPTTLTNLYIADPTLTSNLYDTLESVFQKVSGSATYAGPIFFSSNAQKIANNLYVYRCSDGTYWFRYFGAGDTLYNAYVQMPTYLPQSAHSSYQITSVGTLPGVQPIPGDSTSRFFVLNMEIPGQPSTAIQASGMTDFVIAKNIELDNVLLSGTTYGAEYNMPDSFDNCERVTLKSAISEGIHDWHKYLDSTSQALKAGFMAYVMGAIGEQMLIQYRDQEFDYTLTYYDRAGNRMETVPPQGVQLLDTNHLLLSRVDTSRINNTDTALSQFPAHQKTSTYDYNSNNQLVHQSTPDGGKVDIYYDLDNREIFSQNDKQRTVGSYTYHLYDDQNRLIETGQVDNMGYPWFSDFYEFSMMGDTIHSFPHFSYPSSVPNEFLISPNPRWVEYPAVGWLSPVPADSVPIYVRQYQREDVVMTIYDTAAKNLGIVSGLDTQTNLRERTSCLKFFTTLSPTDTFFNSYTYASHCSYDVDGNLKTLTQEFPALGNTYKYQRYKRIDYDYDLVSGKVNLLSYNRGFPDQFYQRYAYDADNRITSVQTSNDGYIWSTDATYQYYKHGPLARETLGDPLEGVVQGIDYAYTIQGWLKQVNSDTLNGTMDMGLDTGYLVPKDIVAGSIDYFNGDYSNILGASQTHVAAPTLSLYNGNIARQTVAINNLVRLNKQYVYDQLNRINSANYATINAVNQTISGLNDYHNTYQYDNDGNLKQLVRYGNSVATNGTKSTPVLMDSLAYFYPYTIPNNMLRQVTDQSPNNYSNDIQQYTDSTRSRYLYDPTGNMIKDQVSGQDTLTWNLYNKLTSTSNRTADNNMTFVYDGAGNRVAKYFTQINDTGSVPETQNNDYYVRDLQGNILAIYHENYTYKDAPLTPSGWVIPVDDAARTYIGGTSPGHSLNSGFFIPNYASIGAFQTQVIKSSQYNGTFTTSELNHPPSYFMSASSAIYQNMLTGSSGWVVPLGTYEATPHPVLGPAYQAMFAANNIGLAQTLTAALFSDPNTTTQTTVLEIMCSTGNNNLMNQFASMVGVAPNANCNTTAANVQVALEGMSPTAIATDWKNLYSSNPTQMQQFLNLLAYNSTVYSESYYVGTGGQLLPVIQNVLSTYGNPTNVEPFFDQWTGAAAELRAVNTTASLLQIPYNASPITYVNALDDASGDHTIDTAVAAVPGLSYVGYVSALSSTMSIPYSALPVEVSPTSQTFYLAEHDIYGSSRIGAKTYYPTQISAAWTYGSSPTTDTLRLYNRNPWYSEEYQDDIATDSTNLYGNPYLGSLSVQHQEGQKQYELDDHLGDVLATITDKRRGKDLNADGTIDHYVASPEAIYDYFPYGMLMPGRYNVDTSTHCEIVTETGWVPQTVSGSYPLGTSCQPCGITTIGSGTVTYLSPGARLSTTHTGDGMSWANTSVAGATYTTTLGVSGVTGTSYSVQVLDGTTQAVLTGTTIAQAGNIPLVYTAASNSTLFKVTSISATSGTLTCTTAVFSYTILVQGTVATNVCNNNKDSYRYGFNGKLKDNEYAGIGNSLDFGDRGLDTRIGRFRTPDPLTKKFPYYSPYLFAGDKPTVMIDVAGQSEHHYSVAVTIDDKNKMRVTSFKEIKGEAKIDHWQAPWDETFNSMELRAPYVSYPEKRVFNVDVYKQRQNGSTEYDKTVTLEWTPPVKDSRVKENGSIEGGWHLVTTDGEGGDEQRFNKNAGLGSRNVDAGTILRTMKALMAFGRTQPTDPIEALEDLNNSVDLGKDMATDPDKAGIINVDAGGKKEAKKFDQCSSCGEYRNKETHEEINPNDTAGKGITKDNTNVENLEQFHQ